MKKIIAILIIIVNLFSCNDKHDQIMFLGYNIDGYVTYFKENNNNINNNFVMQKGYISYLYTLLIKDAKDVINNELLSSNIKRSKKIYIQIGNDDFSRCINENKTINEDIFITQVELFSYYYFLVLEELRFNYEGEIIVLSPYFKIDNNEIDKNLNSFCEVTKEAAYYFDCKYIDIREISVFINENTLSKDAYSYLDKLINYDSK